MEGGSWVALLSPVDGGWTSERNLAGLTMVVVFTPQTAPNVMDQKMKVKRRAFKTVLEIRDAYVSLAV